MAPGANHHLVRACVLHSTFLCAPLGISLQRLRVRSHVQDRKPTQGDAKKRSAILYQNFRIILEHTDMIVSIHRMLSAKRKSDGQIVSAYFESKANAPFLCLS